MKDSQAAKAVTAWNGLKQWIVDGKPIEINCVNFNYRSGTLVIQPNYKHILQEALSLIGDDLPLDTEPNTGQRIHNKVKQELRNKFNDKYKGE